MELIKQQLSEGVQGVLDGKVSAIEYEKELKELMEHLRRCKNQIHYTALVELQSKIKNA